MTEREQEIRKAIEHFKRGVTHDIFSEPVTTYAMLAVEALKKMAYAEANTEPEGIRFIRGKKSDKELADEVFRMAMSLPMHQKYPIWELVGRFKTLHNQKIGCSVQGEWISANNPPKKRGEYIVAIKYAEVSTTLVFDGTSWSDYSAAGQKIYYDVTHWMPLPAPPKEET